MEPGLLVLPQQNPYARAGAKQDSYLLIPFERLTLSRTEMDLPQPRSSAPHLHRSRRQRCPWTRLAEPSRPLPFSPPTLHRDQTGRTDRRLPNRRSRLAGLIKDAGPESSSDLSLRREGKIT